MPPVGTAGCTTGSARAVVGSATSTCGLMMLQPPNSRTDRKASGLIVRADLELSQALQHLVGDRDGLGVEFVRALRLDHADEFLHHVDVGGLDVILIQHAR